MKRHARGIVFGVIQAFAKENVFCMMMMRHFIVVIVTPFKTKSAT